MILHAEFNVIRNKTYVIISEHVFEVHECAITLNTV
jgi:hypothetical protein